MAKRTKKTEKKIEKEMALPQVSFSTTCNRLRELAKLTRVICDNAVFEFDKDGLEVKTVDKGVTNSGNVIISSDGLDNYKCKPSEAKFGMDFDLLASFLANLKPKDDVECKFDGETLMAHFRAGNLNKKIELRDDFKDWKEWRQQDVNPDYLNVFKEISTADLVIAMKGVEDVNDDEVMFESNKITFIVKAMVETDEIEIPFIDGSDDANLSKHDKKSKTFVSSKFPVGQVKGIVKTMKDKATVSLGDNMPVEFSWYPEDNMGATFMVAPRVKG